jgi:hypothetical protein
MLKHGGSEWIGTRAQRTIAGTFIAHSRRILYASLDIMYHDWSRRSFPFGKQAGTGWVIVELEGTSVPGVSSRENVALSRQYLKKDMNI